LVCVLISTDLPTLRKVHIHANRTGNGLFGVGRPASGDVFSNWLAPGNVFLTGYGTNPGTPLQCKPGLQQNASLPVSTCDPNLITTIEFVGPNTPNPGKTVSPNDWNNFGPAVGFSWQVPWFGEGKTTLRGGYQITYGGSGRVIGGGGATVLKAWPEILREPSAMAQPF
jgi:hypothetical protein